MTRKEEAMQMLLQMENMMAIVEKAPEENTPTMRAFLVLARVVYWLLGRWVKEHEG